MKKIKIGKQVWSKRNLKVDHYRNGDVIPHVKNREDWANLTTGAWCYFKNKKKKKYGKLYNWYAVNDPRGLAPNGWHIPTVEEVKTLQSMVSYRGNPLKAKGVGEEEGAGTNTTGFSARLSGYRDCNGFFSNLYIYTYYWSSDELNKTRAHGLYLHYNNNYANLNSYFKENGFSIRLIKGI